MHLSLRRRLITLFLYPSWRWQHTTSQHTCSILAVIECKCKEGTTDSMTRSSSQEWVISTKEPIYYSWDYNVSIYIDCLLSTTMLWLMASFSAQFYRCWVPPSAFLSSSVGLLRLHFDEGNSSEDGSIFRLGYKSAWYRDIIHLSRVPPLRETQLIWIMILEILGAYTVHWKLLRRDVQYNWLFCFVNLPTVLDNGILWK